jgi:hypothetical protein
MKRKIGTALEAGLYDRAKAAARRGGVSTNALIEEALRRYLRPGGRATSVVRETRGVYKVPARALKAVLREDLYGVD